MRIVTDFSITSAPIRARRRWHPGSLFQDGTPGAWYDPSDLSTLFQDSAGTIPVTQADQPVGQMRDKSGNGFHLSQSIAAARPLYRSAGGLHWLEFDGVDDRMDFAAPLDMNTGTIIIGFVEPENRSARSALFSPSNAGFLSLRLEGDARTMSKNDGGNHALVDTPGSFAMTEQTAAAIRIDGGDIFARREGGVEHTNSTTGRDIFALTMFMAFNSVGQLAAAGDFFGAVLHASHLPSGDVDNALRIINARMGA